jgi:hypothetical protein
VEAPEGYIDEDGISSVIGRPHVRPGDAESANPTIQIKGGMVQIDASIAVRRACCHFPCHDAQVPWDAVLTSLTEDGMQAMRNLCKQQSGMGEGAKKAWESLQGALPGHILGAAGGAQVMGIAPSRAGDKKRVVLVSAVAGRGGVVSFLAPPIGPPNYSTACKHPKHSKTRANTPNTTAKIRPIFCPKPTAHCLTAELALDMLASADRSAISFTYLI